MRSSLTGLGVRWTCLALAWAAASAGLGSEALYQQAKRASVEVLVAGHLAGSGWIADASGLVVSAAHAFGDRQAKLEVRHPEFGRMPLERVAMDLGHDLALLRLPKRAEPYPFLPVAQRMPAPGEDVFLFAAASYRHHLMIRGAAAQDETTFEYLANPGHYVEVYHISAPTPPGTSGGCWMNAAGEVVGSQSGFLAKDQLGIAFVGGPDGIRSLVAAQRDVPRPTLGTAVEELWSQPVGFIRRFPEGTEGLVPVLPEKDGPAERAGLVGDVLIVALDGEPVGVRDVFVRRLLAHRPGDTVRLTILPADQKPARVLEIPLGTVAK